MSGSSTRGTVHIHSVARALCPHIQWALESVAGQSTDLQWYPQPCHRQAVRAVLEWEGPAGTGAVLASALHRVRNVYFEVYEQASPGHDAGRWSYTPDLGVFYAMTDSGGNTVVTEDRIRHAYEVSRGDSAVLMSQFSLALGEAWDTEIEPLREAGPLQEETARHLVLVS